MFFARKKQNTALRLHIDELGDVREQMRRLHLREQELRGAILALRPSAYVMGDHYELECRTTKKRIFQKNALPRHIRDDPVFWRTETIETLKLTPLENARRLSATTTIADDYDARPEPNSTPAPQSEGFEAELAQAGRHPVTPQKVASVNAAPVNVLSEAAEPSAPFDLTEAPRHRDKR